MPLTAVGKTDVGCRRSTNEDAYGLFDDLSLYIVADGMGGHAAGEVASRMAVDMIRDYMTSRANPKESPSFPDISRDLPLIAQHLIASGKVANQKIFELGQSNPAYQGMGTTMVGFVINGNKAYVTHAGDSRAYLIRTGTIKQITEDHSVINEYIHQGRLSKDDAANHPLKHIVTRALGTNLKVDIDINIVPLLDGDILLLCSDGLSNPLSDLEILKEVMDHRTHLEDGCQYLIQVVLDRGGDDNITVILLSYLT